MDGPPATPNVHRRKIERESWPTETDRKNAPKSSMWTPILCMAGRKELMSRLLDTRQRFSPFCWGKICLKSFNDSSVILDQTAFQFVGYGFRNFRWICREVAHKDSGGISQSTRLYQFPSQAIHKRRTTSPLRCLHRKR